MHGMEFGEVSRGTEITNSGDVEMPVRTVITLSFSPRKSPGGEVRCGASLGTTSGVRARSELLRDSTITSLPL